jgi:diamine N-acetyltransferase
MIQIKPATVSDWQLIQEMGRTTFYDTFAADNTEADMQQFLALHYSDEAVQRELADATASFYIIYEEEKDAGYLKLAATGTPPEGLNSGKAVEIERIYVRKDFLGKKIGQALMAFSVEEARRRDCDTIWLGVWEYNARAIAFYKKWGFEIFGTKIFLLGSDAQTDFLMQLSLKP